MAYLTETQASMLSNEDGETRGHALFWRLGTSPGLHFWMGWHDVQIGMEAYDEAGTIYRGAGRLVDMPDFNVLVNGIAEQVEFSIDGLTPDALALLDLTALPSVKGALAVVGIAPLDRHWQARCPIIPMWVGTADYTTQALAPAMPDEPQIYKLGVSCHTGDSTRARARKVAFTHASQQIDHPGDTFFARVMRYVGSYLRIWPRT